jgi:hypothetical protein
MRPSIIGSISALFCFTFSGPSNNWARNSCQSGGINPSDPRYYRIQTPSFLIEFDDTQDNANHIHSVWRDFNGDFGEDLLQQHYAEGHQR